MSAEPVPAVTAAGSIPAPARHAMQAGVAAWVALPLALMLLAAPYSPAFEEVRVAAAFGVLGVALVLAVVAVVLGHRARRARAPAAGRGSALLALLLGWSLLGLVAAVVGLGLWLLGGLRC